MDVVSEKTLPKVNEAGAKAVGEAYEAAIESLFSVLVLNLSCAHTPLMRDEAVMRFTKGAAIAKDALELAMPMFKADA